MPASPPPRSSRAGAGRSSAGAESPRRSSIVRNTRKGWGSVARRGADAITMGEGAGGESKWEEERTRRAPDRDATEWIIENAGKAKTKKRTSRVGGRKIGEEAWHLSETAVGELRERVSPKRVDHLTKTLKDAARAYASERWGDARRALRPLLAEVPDAPSVQELNGMALYRMGKWAAALKQLQEAHEGTGSYDLHPAMMDCCRALRRPKQVASLWEELRQASPSPNVIAEGRIVMAETIADGGDLLDAMKVLEKGPRPRQRVQPHHLRSWYALADLYDRSGDTGKARMMFEKVAKHDPDLADVMERLEALD